MLTAENLENFQNWLYKENSLNTFAELQRDTQGVVVINNECKHSICLLTGKRLWAHFICETCLLQP